MQLTAMFCSLNSPVHLSVFWFPDAQIQVQDKL